MNTALATKKTPAGPSTTIEQDLLTTIGSTPLADVPADIAARFADLIIEPETLGVAAFNSAL